MANGKRKISVIGAGNVGATCAFSLAERKLGDIVMLDIFEGFAKGKALDMSQAGQILNYDGVVTGTCLLYTSPSPRDLSTSRMPSSA